MNEQCIRVICLYRVSTIGQVDKDDIPMQKQCCRTFVSGQPNWKIVREVYEKGVSGFKKSARERDAVQEIQREVEAEEDRLSTVRADVEQQIQAEQARLATAQEELRTWWQESGLPGETQGRAGSDRPQAVQQETSMAGQAGLPAEALLMLYSAESK